MGAQQSHLELLRSTTTDLVEGSLTFILNGETHSVKTKGCDPEIGPRYVLVDYLRDKLGLTGTKYMCREGGCGACVVKVTSKHPVSGRDTSVSANSCLLPLFSCDGLKITTVEALGNRKTGYNPVQERLVKFGGTQCGFCSPGFVMNMNSVAEANPGFTSQDVENSLDGNICRCTGFRPILDAFKSLSADPREELKWKCHDIEDVYKCPLKPLEDKVLSNDKLQVIQHPKNMYLQSSTTGEQWFKVTTLSKLFELLQSISLSQVSYRLVAGNTGTGVYKNDGPYSIYIDINEIPELKKSSFDQSGIVLGGNVTLTIAMNLLKLASQTDGFMYAGDFYNHILRVASHPVRNVRLFINLKNNVHLIYRRGTLAGNLMLKHVHREFPSDIFLLLESVGAKLKIGVSSTLHQDYTLTEFLNLDMNGKVILSIHLPVYDKMKGMFYKSFKIGKRHRNAHAIVNAGFLFQVESDSFKIISRPRICYGGINPNFVHASQTEEYLVGKQLNTSTIQGAMKILENELVPDAKPEDWSPAYRIGLAQSFLYKFMLQILQNEVQPRFRSGAYEIWRGLVTGKQSFDTYPKNWPLNQPIPKLESYPQVSGEAQYINDIRPELGELFGTFVLATVGNATIKSIDATQALNMPGVVAFYTAKDIPGANNYTVSLTQKEEIFIEREVKYAGQSIGLIVATSKYTAFEARSKVIIEYANIKKPMIKITEAIKAGQVVTDITKLNLAMPCKGIDAKRAKEIVLNITKTQPEDEEVNGKVVHSVKGEFQTHGQYHFHMETQICICVPKEDGMMVYSSTQCMDEVQWAVASCLNIPNNSVSVQVRRLGGAFGAKITRSNLIAAACAVAAYRTHQPVRVALDMETNVQMMGKRPPYLVRYNAKVNEEGKILTLKSNVYCDAGSTVNEPDSLYAMICSQSCYQAKNWSVTPGVARTNTASNTFCRAPGSSNGIAIIENMMEHIAYTIQKDPLEVRKANFIHEGDPFIGVPGAKLITPNPLPEMLIELQKTSDYESRKKFVESFNQANRWKKRGLSIVPQRFPVQYPDFRLPTFISVYHVDGTVNVSHGGIEMGQGINTKVVQVVAYTLNIPIDSVKVKPTNNLISPNTALTAASVTTELVCHSAQQACLELLRRIEPIRKQLENASWQQLIAACNVRGILLTSQWQGIQGDVIAYDLYGATSTEVEVDILTGDFKIVRVDLLEDAGQSLSPLIDIGQIEGAFIMGLSWWLTEELIYDPTSGVLLTDRTWNYKPMLASDIPEDFRVTILRNAPNPFGVLSSKATSEPPLNMSCSVIFAIRNAIDSARREAGNHSWYQMNGPVTRETIRQLSLVAPEEFTV